MGPGCGRTAGNSRGGSKKLAAASVKYRCQAGLSVLSRWRIVAPLARPVTPEVAGSRALPLPARPDSNDLPGSFGVSASWVLALIGENRPPAPAGLGMTGCPVPRFEPNPIGRRRAPVTAKPKFTSAAGAGDQSEGISNTRSRDAAPPPGAHGVPAVPKPRRSSPTKSGNSAARRRPSRPGSRARAREVEVGRSALGDRRRRGRSSLPAPPPSVPQPPGEGARPR